MRVLLAGATSTFGKPLADELIREGHDVTGLTRSKAKARAMERRGIPMVVADVLEPDQLTPAVVGAQPDAVISLLITLPKSGPMRPSQVHPNLRLWATGVPNLIQAAQSAGAGRFIAESFVFAYGYGQWAQAADRGRRANWWRCHRRAGANSRRAEKDGANRHRRKGTRQHGASLRRAASVLPPTWRVFSITPACRSQTKGRGLRSAGSQDTPPSTRLLRLGWGSNDHARSKEVRLLLSARQVNCPAGPRRAGKFPARTAYAAFDPELMLWTLAVIADSAREMYEVLARPLSNSEREGLWSDYLRFGELFGLSRQAMPGSFRESGTGWQAVYKGRPVRNSACSRGCPDCRF